MAWMLSSITPAACAAVKLTADKRTMAKNAPTVFLSLQFRGSAWLSEGMGSLRVLPSLVTRNVVPERSYDSRFAQVVILSALVLTKDLELMGGSGVISELERHDKGDI